MLERLGLVSGNQVKISQGRGIAKLEIASDEKLPNNCVRIACAHPMTIALGDLFGEVFIEKL